MAFDYKHNQKKTVNTELGKIILTYIVADELPENVLGEKDTSENITAPTYWEAWLDSKSILCHGVTAESAIEEVYKIDALRRKNNLKLDLPI